MDATGTKAHVQESLGGGSCDSVPLSRTRAVALPSENHLASWSPKGSTIHPVSLTKPPHRVGTLHELEAKEPLQPGPKHDPVRSPIVDATPRSR